MSTRQYEKNIQLTGLSEKGKELKRITFGDGSYVEMSLMDWYFAYQLYGKYIKKYGLNLEKWPKWMWK